MLYLQERSVFKFFLQTLCAAVAVSAVLTSGAGAAGSVTLVEEGKGRAAVVIAADPSPMAQYAAEELIRHIQKATGATLPLLRENEDLSALATRIYVGNTQAASDQGLKVETLEPEASLLRTIQGQVFVLGREDATADPLDEANGLSGTLFGVYELLERFLHVRWLWPGELGTFIPAATSVTFAELDEIIQPVIEFRELRWLRMRNALRRYHPQTKAMAFSDEGLRAFADAQRVFLRRHRMGTRLKPEQYINHGRAGHAMARWWELYGQEHPEFFMMDETGRRGHYEPKSRHVDPCLSNPDFHRFVVETIWDGGNVLRLGAKDHHSFCHCENCLAWDQPVPEDRFMREVISNRYARFYKAIYDLAVQKNPEVEITAYAYMNYFTAPHPDIQLNDRIYIEYVPWGRGSGHWYPATEDRMSWLREQWLGWQRTGAKLGYRPNWELGGYAMPQLHTWQGGAFFKFAAENGMSAMTLSPRSQFAVRGPEHYMYARLTAKPELSVEQIREEFFSAFGPAAEVVEAYFDCWENHSQKLFDEGQWYSMWSNPAPAPRQYPEAVFDKAQKFLTRAMVQAAADERPEYAHRIDFLQAGLEHARLSARFIDALTRFVNGTISGAEARQILQQLASFRRGQEHKFIADYLHLVAVERRQYSKQIDQLLSGENLGSEETPYRTWTPIQVPAYLTQTEAGPYLGYGWYRTAFNVTDQQRSGGLKLQFEGVDKQAWVYVNSRRVGEHTPESEGLPLHELYDRPFQIQVGPEQLIVGENLLVIRMHSSDGNAGIYRPVFLRLEGQILDSSTLTWEFRKDPENTGLQHNWHSVMPGEH